MRAEETGCERKIEKEIERKEREKEKIDQKKGGERERKEKENLKVFEKFDVLRQSYFGGVLSVVREVYLTS